MEPKVKLSNRIILLFKVFNELLFFLYFVMAMKRILQGVKNTFGIRGMIQSSSSKSSLTSFILRAMHHSFTSLMV